MSSLRLRYSFLFLLLIVYHYSYIPFFMERIFLDVSFRRVCMISFVSSTLETSSLLSVFNSVSVSNFETPIDSTILLISKSKFPFNLASKEFNFS